MSKKTKYRIKLKIDHSDNKSLVQRGNLTVWLDKNDIDSW